jgi:PAS domain S-box-containing protein
MWDLEGRILDANDEFLRIVGYDRSDLLSASLRWTDLTPPEWLERHTREWLPELRITGMVPPYEKEYFRKDGSRVPVLVATAMLEERSDQGVGFVLDLSERKRAEADLRKVQTELAHANRVTALGQLTASISHEIRQPIEAIAVNASAGQRWLARAPSNLAEISEALERIVRDTKRAGEVIKRIHGFVVKAPTIIEMLQINEAIREVVALTSGQASKSGVSVRVELAEDLPLVQGDRVQVQQVMLNLSINAIDAMSAVDGVRELMISTALGEPGVVLVSVADSGHGVPPAHFERLFEPFYTTKASGMGMGLSICRSIVDAHGGRLWAEANIPRGAIFQFTMPVHRTAQA